MKSEKIEQNGVALVWDIKRKSLPNYIAVEVEKEDESGKYMGVEYVIDEKKPSKYVSEENNHRIEFSVNGKSYSLKTGFGNHKTSNNDLLAAYSQALNAPELKTLFKRFLAVESIAYRLSSQNIDGKKQLGFDASTLIKHFDFVRNNPDHPAVKSYNLFKNEDSQTKLDGSLLEKLNKGKLNEKESPSKFEYYQNIRDCLCAAFEVYLPQTKDGFGVYLLEAKDDYGRMSSTITKKVNGETVLEDKIVQGINNLIKHGVISSIHDLEIGKDTIKLSNEIRDRMVEEIKKDGELSPESSGLLKRMADFATPEGRLKLAGYKEAAQRKTEQAQG